VTSYSVAVLLLSTLSSDRVHLKVWHMQNAYVKQAGLRHRPMFEVFDRTGPWTLKGPQFWTIKIQYKLYSQFERLWRLDYDANRDINTGIRCVCEHTMQQNAIAAGASPAPAEQFTALPLDVFKGTLRGGEGEWGRGREVEKRGRSAESDRKGRWCKLEQGRRLAKTSPGVKVHGCFTLAVYSVASV